MILLYALMEETAMLEDILRTKIRRFLTKEKHLALENKVPRPDQLRQKFDQIHHIGLYLHIPFCEQICPYCPYNKELYSADTADAYKNAVKKEVDFYRDIICDTPVTSFYIGGGTPTTMLYTGLREIVEYVFRMLNMQCDIHMESHLNHLTLENLHAISDMGVQHLSMGVEALQDRHLKMLGRPYTADKAKAVIERTVRMDFKCVNVDLMFALPEQREDEIEQAGHALVEMGVDQIAAYPLFRFPYTKLGGTGSNGNYNLFTIFKRRKMLGILENIFYNAGFERTSVWAFTQKGVPKYCSVTVPLYVGLGASGGTYLRDLFYLNTFNVSEYIKTLENNRMPIALSIELSENMQIGGWLYWRIYETKFKRSDFGERFGREFDNCYGTFIKFLKGMNFLTDDGDQIILTDKGTYWLHAMEDILSIDYVSKLWGTSRHVPWPQEVIL
jgi:coproporphyrinogen III oxidase-like Fe-S oxidoreductase